MIRVAILTLSDKGSRGEREDISGPAIKDVITTVNGRVDYYEVIPDEKDLIKEKLIEYSNKVDLILTTGGTGLSPRDVTPDATLDVIERPVPGIAEAIRVEGFKKTDRAMLSRAVAGVLGNSLIINLPGSPKAIRESLDVIKGVLPHAIEKIRGGTDDCAIQEDNTP
ncbi:MAG: MogA/MoaB family molybdenum cofactor biosynthesis protein [Nitrospiraceae bacterium]|nr:MAG: MogA/MoaB family molybdenum cofactor biosynthesis protein [Nitrospiraceae bacterium]